MFLFITQLIVNLLVIIVGGFFCQLESEEYIDNDSYVSIGFVESVGDGIASVKGLDGCKIR